MDLYHRIDDADCASVRKRVVELGLQEQINFRNVAVSDEAQADLVELTGDQTVPVLSLYGALLSGKIAIIDYLEQMARDPAFTLYPEFDQHAHQVWNDFKALVSAHGQSQADRLELLIEDEPDPELLAGLEKELQLAPDELCGFFQPPAKMRLFRFALLDLLEQNAVEPVQSLRHEIAITLVHELGELLGLSEADLDRLNKS